MDTFMKIIALIPALIALIKEIEKVIPTSGQGAEKLEAVKKILEAAYDGISGIWPVIEKVVAALVGLFNKTGVFSGKA
jgi:hypothetical protein